MENKDLNASVKCLNCGKVNFVTADKLCTEKKFLKINGKEKEIFLIAFLCPDCGTKNIVQVDDAETKRLLSECLQIMRDFRNEKNKLSKAQILTQKNAFEKKRKKLKNARLKLNRDVKNELEKNSIENFVFNIFE